MCATGTTSTRQVVRNVNAQARAIELNRHVARNMAALSRCASISAAAGCVWHAFGLGKPPARSLAARELLVSTVKVVAARAPRRALVVQPQEARRATMPYRQWHKSVWNQVVPQRLVSGAPGSRCSGDDPIFSKAAKHFSDDSIHRIFSCRLRSTC